MEVVKIDTEIAEAFKINIAEVQDMVKEYQNLTLIPEDEDSYKICRVALTSCIKTRTGIDKRRLKLNKEDQERIKGRNVAAKQLTAIIEPAETHLTSLVKGEDIRLKAIQEAEEAKEREKIDKRIADLAEYRVMLPFMEVSTMTDEEFEALIAKEKVAYETEQKRIAEEEFARKAENDRLEKVREEQEVEAEKLRKQKEDLDAKEKAIQDEKNRIEIEKAAEQGRKDREAFEKKAKAEAKIQAEADAKEKVEREAKEKIEKEKAEAKEKKRQEKLRPIKDRIYDYADDLLKEPPPTFKDSKATELIQWATTELKELSNLIKMKADDL